MNGSRLTQPFVLSLFLCGVVVLAMACRPIVANAEQPRYPFPQHVAYAPGSILPNHRSQIQLDADVRAAYDHWKTMYLKAAGEGADGQPLYRVSFGSTNPARTVSEGQGYGMVIVPLLAGYDPDAQKEFDGLWAFARQYPSAIEPRLMGWQVPPDPGGSDSAFDGDADIAYGLLLADAQWGSQGKVNYRAAAQTVIAGIRAATIGPDSHLPTLGDWVDVDGQQYNQYTPRSSDFMLDHFRAYGRATDDPFWTSVVTATQQVIDSLQVDHSPQTGLLPDFIVPISPTDHTPKPAPPNFLENTTDGDYYYNAGRVPWRLGTAALLNNDPRTLAQVRKLTAWAFASTNGDPKLIRPGYHLNGDPIATDYWTTFFAAPFGVAAMTDATQQKWLNALYDAVYNTHEDYYEDSVTLLCLLVMTRNYWDPTARPATAGLYLPLIAQ